jgi:hypothetical protein
MKAGTPLRLSSRMTIVCGGALAAGAGVGFSSAPHSLQNLNFLGFLAPQLLHCMADSPLKKIRNLPLFDSQIDRRYLTLFIENVNIT